MKRRGLLEIDKSDGLTGMGTLRPELIGCLVIVFFVLYFSLFKGVKSSGKVLLLQPFRQYFHKQLSTIRSFGSLQPPLLYTHYTSYKRSISSRAGIPSKYLECIQVL